MAFLREDGEEFLTAIDHGSLPQVAFYKPVGDLNEHPGYTDVLSGDKHIKDILGRIRNSPIWANTVVIVTYDENGGWWDHAAPPKGDLVGPGTRIPALIISPFAKKGLVDHTLYDTASTLRFITHRYSLPVLGGLQTRDDAVTTSTGKPMGDLTNVLSF